MLVVRDDDPTPPFEQVRRQLAALVASGALAPDQRLPPVRQLAADLGLAVGTVARAYRELEAAGTVTTRRGAGTRVAAPGPVAVAGSGAVTGVTPAIAERAAERAAADELAVMAGTFVARARAVGVRDAEITAAVRDALRRATPAPSRAAPPSPAIRGVPGLRAHPAG